MDLSARTPIVDALRLGLPGCTNMVPMVIGSNRDQERFARARGPDDWRSRQRHTCSGKVAVSRSEISLTLCKGRHYLGRHVEVSGDDAWYVGP